MYSILKAIYPNHKDNTKVTLLYAKKTKGGTVLRKELDEYVEERPHKFKLWYVLDSPPKG